MSEKAIRKRMWLSHGCKIPALYGDDGEMQCNHCQIDFKRDDFHFIAQQLRKADTHQLQSENERYRKVLKASASIIRSWLLSRNTAAPTTHDMSDLIDKIEQAIKEKDERTTRAV